MSARDRWRNALLPSKLGACLKCMALSSGLLAVSFVTLLAAVARLPDFAVAVTAMAFGFFATFTAAHVVMFLVRAVIKPREGSPVSRSARRRCS